MQAILACRNFRAKQITEAAERRRARMLQTVVAAPATMASTLVVVFSGGTLHQIGISRQEFKEILAVQDSPNALCDMLFVQDTSGMSFYAHGETDLFATLKEAFTGYGRVVMVGDCMGATGALRCAHLLQGSIGTNSTVLAFNPEI
eukprot:gene23967-25711_t